MRTTALLAIVFLTGCTDAGWGKFQALGGSANVKCYSGTKLIYEGSSTGKVVSEARSDGYNFVDKKSKRLMEVSGNCVITYTEY